MEHSTQIVSNAWVFQATRVPVIALFENLQSGATVEQFLEWFPGVERWQVDAVLAFTIASLHPAEDGIHDNEII